MTETEHVELEKYTRELANLMELRDWTISVLDNPPDGTEAIACITCIYGQKYARIRVRHDFFDRDPENQRQIIAHELLHIHLSGLEWSFNNRQGQLAPPVFQMAWDGLKDVVEFGVDAIADAIARYLPLPPAANEGES